MWQEGDNPCEDVYECLVFDPDCFASAQETLWYGCETDNTPEQCGSTDEDACLGGVAARGNTNIKGHTKTVTSWQIAWDDFSKQLERTGSDIPTHRPKTASSIYKIPADNKTKLAKPVYVMVTKVPTAPANKISKVIGDRYFGIEVDPLDSDIDTTNPASFNSAVHVGPGQQLRVDYVVGSETRRALIWLKKP